MSKAAAIALLLLAPALAFAQEAELTVSKSAVVAGEQVPVEAVLSAPAGMVLSDSQKSGAVPVTITVYLSQKPKPQAATSSQVAAAVESSQGIQSSIAGVSPQAGSVLEPVFRLVDGGRQAAADVLDAQITASKERLDGTKEDGQVLGSEQSNAASDPMGAATTMLQTVLLYIFTILRWLVGNAGVFYPVAALLFFYMLWKLIRRLRRPAY